MFGVPAWAVGVVAILGGVGLMAFLIELGDGLKRRALGMRHESRGPHTVVGVHMGSATPEALAAPGAVEDLERRVAELEERLDFAERMLAQRNEAERRALQP